METVFQCMPFINTCLPMRRSVTKRQKIFIFKGMRRLFKRIKKNENKVETQNIGKGNHWREEEKLYLNSCPCKVCDLRRALKSFFWENSAFFCLKLIKISIRHSFNINFKESQKKIFTMNKTISVKRFETFKLRNWALCNKSRFQRINSLVC